ncbi:formate/nitrite transporter family protein [Streptomyces hydrogenans]|uniref:formate/nitrite transporter family protein n=1 Tax=Streptomyces hydrogenans TaxID=1873719 RepID=UPI0035DA1E9F
MISVAQNLREAAGQAAHKAHELRRPGRYAVSAVLAGAYIAVGEVLLLVAVSPFVAEGSPVVRLLEGMVFPIALTTVMFAGAQLFTSNVMLMLLGALAGRTGPRDLVGSWALSLAGNFVGAFLLGAMAHASGVLSAPSARAMLAELVAGKQALDGGQLFWRAVLCNMLVCLGVWMFSRARGDGAKIFVLWLPVLVFVAVGFEHCVANMALFSMAILDGTAGFGELAHNLLFTLPGNVVGGGVLVGGAYWFTGRPAGEPVPDGVPDPRGASDSSHE